MALNSSPDRVVRYFVLGVVLWTAITGGGLALLNAYAGTEGKQGEVPEAWPAGSRLEPDPELPTLLAFLHPQCPCSSATLEGLARLLARHGEQVSAQFVFVRPAGLGPELLEGANWQLALHLPGARIVVDEDGREAERFGAVTSGAVMLYSAAERLLFAGGVTPARGHAGDNAGLDALIALLEQRTPRAHATPVFGCGFLADDEPPHAECRHD